MDFVIGGLAGALPVVVTNPMDVVKTRMQLQGELQAHSKHTAKFKGMLHALYLIGKTDGALALQKGLVPSMLVSMSMNSVRLGIYSIADVNGLMKTKGEIDIYKTVLWSSFSGFMSGFASNPASVLKIRMQAVTHPSIAVGRQHIYSGMLDGCLKIYKTEGIRGFFAGVYVSCTGFAVGTAAQLTTFTMLKEMLVSRGICKDSPLGVSFIASSISSVMVSIASCPFDTVAVRLYNQGPMLKGDSAYYNGAIDCFRKTYKIEGIRGLFKGLGPHYVRLAPHVTLSLVIWDMLNMLLYNKKR